MRLINRDSHGTSRSTKTWSSTTRRGPTRRKSGRQNRPHLCASASARRRLGPWRPFCGGSRKPFFRDVFFDPMCASILRARAFARPSAHPAARRQAGRARSSVHEVHVEAARALHGRDHRAPARGQAHGRRPPARAPGSSRSSYQRSSRTRTKRGRAGDLRELARTRLRQTSVGVKTGRVKRQSGV